jgi:hypothetical protein
VRSRRVDSPEEDQTFPELSRAGLTMVEYAVLLAQSSSDIISMTANDVLSWTRLNWVSIGIAALGLISFRMAFRAFTGR